MLHSRMVELHWTSGCPSSVGTLHASRFQRLLSWDFDRLIIAHGPCIERDAKAFVTQAFRWLTG